MADDLVAIVDSRAAEANKRPEGADWKQIIKDVAVEHGVEPKDLTNDCLDAWHKELGIG